MTRYEYYIKKLRSGHLRNEDTRIILSFQRKVSYITLEERDRARKLIKEKNINLNILGLTFYRIQEKPAFRYNMYCKKITDCLTNEQWELLKKYYNSVADKTDEEVQ